MECVERNKRDFYYANYTGSVEVVDDDGNYTGEYTAQYGAPTLMRANISPSAGSTRVMQFGRFLDYTKTIVTSEMDCPINEYSILWIDANPTTDEHDYAVVSIAKGFHSITYAIKKVEVSSNG